MRLSTHALNLSVLAAALLAGLRAEAHASTSSLQQHFVELHAQFFGDIRQRANALHAKLDQVEQLALSINGSAYVGPRQTILNRVNALKARIGAYGSYSVTTADEITLRIPNEDVLDDLIDDLEDAADELEDRADDRDDDDVEELAEELQDLVDDVDHLESRLTFKTNRLKRRWLLDGGDVEYF